MKYLNNYKIFENQDIDAITKSYCKNYSIYDYTINDDGSIDVYGDVNLRGYRITNIPFKFNRVSGHFSTDCVKTLDGCPNWVGKSFYCYGNGLTSLEGAPRYIGQHFNCSNNKITSLEGYPEYVGGGFNCINNPIYEIVQYFIHRENRDNLIELFNYYDIVQGTDVIYDRLKYFYDLTNIALTELRLDNIKQNGYTIIR